MKLIVAHCLKDVLRTTLLFGTVTLLWAGTPARAQEFVSPWATNLSFGVGADYSTGTFGTDIRTNSVVFPITVEWRPLEWLDLQVGVPHITRATPYLPPM